MPAADNTQSNIDTAQFSPTTGTPMPDDPTGLLFQAPDFSQVPVRRRQQPSADDSEHQDRNEQQDRGKNNRQRRKSSQQSDRNDRQRNAQQRSADDSDESDDKEPSSVPTVANVVSRKSRKTPKMNSRCHTAVGVVAVAMLI